MTGPNENGFKVTNRWFSNTITHQNSIANPKILVSSFLYRATVRHVGPWLVARFHSAVQQALSERDHHSLARRAATAALLIQILGRDWVSGVAVASLSDQLSGELGGSREDALEGLALKVAHTTHWTVIFAN